MTNARRGSIRQEANGRWVAIVDVGTPGHRKQVRRRFDKKGDAQNWINRTARNAADGDYVDVSKKTVDDYLTEWLEAQASRGLRPTTLDSYARIIRTQVKPRIGTVRLQQLTTGQLDSLYADMQKSGRLRGAKTRGAGVSARTTRYTHTILRKAFADAVRKHLIVRNPADAADPPTAKAAAAPETPVWTPDELRGFLTNKDVREHDLFPLFRLAAVTGLRRGELVALRWRDVDLERGLVRVAQAATAVKGEIRIGRPKTDRSLRVVTIGPSTVDLLRDRLTTQNAHRARLGAGWRDYGLLFPTVDGSPRHPDTVTTAFARLVKDTSLPRLTFHGLRHSHLSALADEGENPLVISERAGHATPGFTLSRYGHVFAASRNRAALAVEARLDGQERHLAEVVGDEPQQTDHELPTAVNDG